jgi:hypothetical protein
MQLQDFYDTRSSPYHCYQSFPNGFQYRCVYRVSQSEADIYIFLRKSSYHCNGPRDKCVTLSGLAYESAFLLSTQTYLQSINQIYMSAAKSIIVEDDNEPLNFLEFAGLPRIRLDLRSWVPDWSYIGILRRHDKQYEFVGCCYFHGLMQGQAIARLHNGDFRAPTFDIR